MRTVLRDLVIVALAIVVGVGPLPLPATADDSASAATIKRILSADQKQELSLPTDRVQRVSAVGEQIAIQRNGEGVPPGEALLTRSASTVVHVDKGPDAYLYPETFVRFDEKTVWLLRIGAVFVVNTKGRLEVVAEALGRVLVSSKVLLRSDGTELFAFVTEGRVVLEAGARTLSLGKGQAGRMTMGGAPERVSLGAEEQAEISKGLEATEKVMKGGGGGGGGLLAGLVAAGVVVGAAAILSGHDKDDRGGGSGGTSQGGSPGLPDLALDTSSCRLESGNLVISIRNQGRADAPPATHEVVLPAVSSRVARFPAQKREVRTPALRPGAAVEVRVDVDGAQGGRFTIHLDSYGRVTESDEANNTAEVSCQPSQDSLK